MSWESLFVLYSHMLACWSALILIITSFGIFCLPPPPPNLSLIKHLTNVQMYKCRYSNGRNSHLILFEVEWIGCVVDSKKVVSIIIYYRVSRQWVLQRDRVLHSCFTTGPGPELIIEYFFILLFLLPSSFFNHLHLQPLFSRLYNIFLARHLVIWSFIWTMVVLLQYDPKMEEKYAGVGYLRTVSQ